MSESGIFKIRPAGRHILTIGRDLIQDPYAAVVELVKNAYDADATDAYLLFEKFKNTTTGNDEIKIAISDNGHGMTRSVVTDNWMVPSTDDKQIRKISPNGRVMQGRKGIGRYASGILGDDLFLETVSNGEKTSLLVNWADFENAKYLSDVDILIETKKEKVPNGTTLVMTGSEAFLCEWDDEQFRQLTHELKKLMTPLVDTKVSKDDNFNIFLTITNFGSIDTNKEKIEPFPLFDLYDYKISGKVESNEKENLFMRCKKYETLFQFKLNIIFLTLQIVERFYLIFVFSIGKKKLLKG